MRVTAYKTSKQVSGRSEHKDKTYHYGRGRNACG
jgi:hypothetical protein